MLARLVQSALVAATLIAGLGTAAQAAEPRMAAGIVLVDHRDGDRDGHRGRHWDRHDDRGRGRDWDDRGPHRGPRFDDRRGGICSPRHALDKASRFGVRRADVVRVSRRAVVVAGFKRGHPTVIRFAQARGCPVIGGR